MNTDAIESMVRDVLSRMNSLEGAAPAPAPVTNEYGQHVVLHPGKLLSYTDVLKSGGEIVVLRQKCLVTALAREAAEARNIQLIKQE